MSKIAHKIKKNDFILDDAHVYMVVEKEEHKRGSNTNVHLTLADFMTNHKKKVHFSHDHNVRVVEPEVNTYSLKTLGEMKDDHLYLNLVDHEGEVNNNMFVTEEFIQRELLKYFKVKERKNDKYDYSEEAETEEVKPLKVLVSSVFVDKLHRTDKVIHFSKVVSIESIDMKHLYDHHHGHHHDHKKK